jgi:hypothetical protein
MGYKWFLFDYINFSDDLRLINSKRVWENWLSIIILITNKYADLDFSWSVQMAAKSLTRKIGEKKSKQYDGVEWIKPIKVPRWACFRSATKEYA